MLHKITYTLLVLFLMVGGCAAPGPFDDSIWPEPRPLGSDMETVRPARSPEDSRPDDAFHEPTGSLSLRDALAATLLRSPMLAATGYEVRAQEAEALQAGLYPNPEMELEFMNFGGTGQFGDFNSLQTKLTLSQVIELGGKRMKRHRVAEYGTRLAGWDYEIMRIDVLSKATADYVSLLAAERCLRNAEETFELAQRIFDAVSERVDAGKVSPVERIKARVELAQVELARGQADRAVRAARVHLASNWGSTDPQFTHLTGNIEHTDSLPTLDSIIERVEQNPDIARWVSEAALRQAEIELALAQRVPDFSLMGGMKHFNGADEVAFVAGLSLPLAVFDRNQGGIRAARLRSLQGDRLSEAAQIRVRTAVVEAYLNLESAHISVRMTQDTILPSAQSAFDAAEEAFRQGKIGALDLFDSERTLFSAHRQLTDALTNYHFAIIAAERLIGAPLHEADYVEGNK